MWIEYNPNPTGRRVEDCSIRAIAKALNISWEDAYTLVTSNGYLMGDMPHSNSVWGAVLREHGFYRKSIPNTIAYSFVRIIIFICVTSYYAFTFHCFSFISIH